jgi:alcohol dehydrogenase
VTAATGINALAHCIEALYSRTRNPVATTSALGGLRAIMLTLPRCYAHGDDADARCQLLSGAYLAGSALAHVSMALHHGLCHVLGGSAGIPHGVANAIILPHAMRFNLDATAPRLAQAAQVLGLTATNDEQATRKLIDLVETLINNLNLPQRLRDAGVTREDLPGLAELAFQNRTVQSNPKPITSVAQMEKLLQAAW